MSKNINILYYHNHCNKTFSTELYKTCKIKKIPYFEYVFVVKFLF